MAFTIDLRWLRVLSLRRPSPNTNYRWSVWPAGAMVVDRSDRKLINDAPAALLRIEDRLLSLPVSSLAQLEGWWTGTVLNLPYHLQPIM